MKPATPIPTEGFFSAPLWSLLLGVTEAEFLAEVERRGVPVLRPGTNAYVSCRDFREFFPDVAND